MSHIFCNVHWILCTLRLSILTQWHGPKCKQTQYLIHKAILGKVDGVYVTNRADTG